MSVEKTRRSSWFVSLLTLLVAFQMATPAGAWGALGHRVIARLAEKHLTPEAKAAVAALLEPGESIADASLWADEHRGRLPKTAPWHYVDVPLDEPRYDKLILERFGANLGDSGSDQVSGFFLASQGVGPGRPRDCSLELPQIRACASRRTRLVTSWIRCRSHDQAVSR